LHNLDTRLARLGNEDKTCTKSAIGKGAPGASGRDAEEVSMTTAGKHQAGIMRRPKAAAKRERSIRFDLTETEYQEVTAAASRAGLARGAYAARATVAAARGTGTPTDEPLRQALGELIRASGLVRRIGVNLNQAVARLNATGQPSGDLLPYARESLRRADNLDRAAEAVRRRLR
jgi:hypothetical protein